jgi:molybdopterin converting factor small subunit
VACQVTTGEKSKCTEWVVENLPMNQFKVRYFAAFREATGVESEQVHSSATTPAELFAECTARFGQLQSYSAAKVAINDEMSGWDSPLANGDEVLFFPPVAGG